MFLLFLQLKKILFFRSEKSVSKNISKTIKVIKNGKIDITILGNAKHNNNNLVQIKKNC